jgi:hypothetical protein
MLTSLRTSSQNRPHRKCLGEKFDSRFRALPKQGAGKGAGRTQFIGRREEPDQKEEAGSHPEEEEEEEEATCRRQHRQPHRRLAETLTNAAF